jgi:CubicO group peptidase (beta-lactamase class C family)
MPTILRAFFSFVLIVFFLNTCTSQETNPAYSKETEDKIKQVENGLSGWVQAEADKSAGKWNLQDRMKFYKVNGLSIAVIHNYKIEWARGYGLADTTDKRPVNIRTLFQAASISKSLNAMGVLKLADKKQIDLHTDINTYLKSWKLPESAAANNKKITTAHLLSHTAGLSVHGFPGYDWKDSIPTDNEILDGKRPANTMPVRSVFEPGTKYQYSGGGTTISKKIIMDISGQEYDMYMWKQVLEPIGMTNSFYTQPPPPGSFPILSTAYYADGKKVRGNFHVYPEQAPDGLWTNPTDLCKYIIEMQLSLQGKSNKVLSKAMTDTMLTPFVDKSAALGVFIDRKGNEKYFQHGGANEGFRCQYFGSMENGNGVAVMVNSDNGNIMQEIINSVATAYQWKDFYTPVVKKIVPVKEEILKSYIGDYQVGELALTVIQQADGLYLSQNGVPFKMIFTSDTDFFIFEVPAELSFQKNEQGVINTLFIKQGGQEYKLAKK